jgi:hypothetical protein
MLSSKNKFIGYTALILVGVVFFIIVINRSFKAQRLGENYIDDFELDFSGIVSDKKEITSNSGLLYLKNVSGISIDYDPRDSLEYYCCVIKGKKAEIIVAGMRLYEKGDSIFVNGSANKVFHYRNHELIQELNLTLTRFDLLYKPARKLHKL